MDRHEVLYKVVFENDKKSKVALYVVATGICPAIEKACAQLFQEKGLSAADFEPVKAEKDAEVYVNVPWK